jgi:TonB family protein
MKKEERQKVHGQVRIATTLFLVFIVSAAIASCTNSKNTMPAPPPPPPPPEASAPAGNQVYDSVDVMPEYPGGNEALVKYISDNIRYPEEARKSSTQGKVLVSFVVEKDGSVDNVKVLRGVDSLIDSEALRVVRTLPDFEKPGIREGKNVAVKYILPISFKLDGKK